MSQIKRTKEYAEAFPEPPETVRCRECGNDVLHRKMVEIGVGKVIKEVDGFLDEFDNFENTFYEYRCGKCGHDCTHEFDAEDPELEALVAALMEGMR